METIVANGFVLQSGATTGNGTVADLDGVSRELTLYIIGSAGVGAGAIQLETADTATYAGTWAALGSPVTVVASAQVIVQKTGCFKFVRARVSTTVTGGSVTARLYAN